MSKHTPDGLRRLVSELRRRRTFRTAGLYVVGAWLVMQVADVLFPGWGLPDQAINVLLVALVTCFPLALVFGWFYDITPGGIVRTPPPTADEQSASLALRPTDYLILGGLVAVVGLVVYDTVGNIQDTPQQVANSVLPSPAPLPMVPNSIAVLPFLNISNDPDNEAFCDGISEEILHKLGRFAELHVIGRTSSFAFKGSSVQIPQIAAALGVRYLLQGSVRKAGDELRISAQLVDETGAQRWSDSFDRRLENIFAIQSEIADLVATTVVPRIQPEHTAAHQPDVGAYEHYLAGREHLYKRDHRRAEVELQEAIDLDPKFAEPYAELAISRSIGPSISQQRADESHALIDQALALHPGLPRALAARGLLLTQQPQPEYASAVRLLQQALDAEPTMVDALNWLGNPLRALDRDEEAQAMLERGLALDPLHPVIVTNYSLGLMRGGQVERAEQMLLRLTSLPAPSFMPFMALRSLYRETGQLVKMNANGKRRALAFPGPYYDLEFNYALLGDWDKSAFWIGRSNQDHPGHWYTEYNRAGLAMWQGDYAGAILVFDELMAAKPTEDGRGHGLLQQIYGINLALAGRFEEAISILRPIAERERKKGLTWDLELVDAYHALAWADLSLGRAEDARELLNGLAESLASPDNPSGPGASESFFLRAQTALLLDDIDGALSLLGQAVDAGWRGYYIRHHDPRWASVRDDSRYQALMSRVRADIDRQAAEIAQIDAEEDFVALLDEVIARRRKADALTD